MPSPPLLMRERTLRQYLFHSLSYLPLHLVEDAGKSQHISLFG